MKKLTYNPYTENHTNKKKSIQGNLLMLPKSESHMRSEKGDLTLSQLLDGDVRKVRKNTI